MDNVSEQFDIHPTIITQGILKGKHAKIKFVPPQSFIFKFLCIDSIDHFLKSRCYNK